MIYSMLQEMENTSFEVTIHVLVKGKEEGIKFTFVVFMAIITFCNV